MFRCVVGSQLYGAALPSSDTDILTISWGGESDAWTPTQFVVRAAHGYPIAVQALYAPACAISVGEPLVALRPFLMGPSMLLGLTQFLQTNMTIAEQRPGWSRQLWQAVVIQNMLTQLRSTHSLTLPFPNAQALMAMRGHPDLAWAQLPPREGSTHVLG